MIAGIANISDLDDRLNLKRVVQCKVLGKPPMSVAKSWNLPDDPSRGEFMPDRIRITWTKAGLDRPWFIKEVKVFGGFIRKDGTLGVDKARESPFHYDDDHMDADLTGFPDWVHHLVAELAESLPKLDR